MSAPEAAHGGPGASRPGLDATARLLVAGGDTRIAPDERSGLNRYGCPPFPDPGLIEFGSSTASVISPGGYAAAAALRDRLDAELVARPGIEAAALYARELERVRGAFLALAGAGPPGAVELVFAASGTDLHLLAAQLVASRQPARPTVAVVVEPGETGSGVPAALAGRHFSARSALAASTPEGAAIAGAGSLAIATVPLRHPDGTPRDPAHVDADVTARVESAVAAGQQVLLVLVDLSKSGAIAPSPAAALALQQRFRGEVELLVDACQFRLAPETVSSYLARGCWLALTGSKFLTGPTFSGALLIPASAAPGLRDRALPLALASYSSRAEWPAGWAAAAGFAAVPNFGLLLRWEAALAELRAFRSVPAARVGQMLEAFASAIEARLAMDPWFEPLPRPSLDRSPIAGEGSWDRIQTIFPFVLQRPAGLGPARALTIEESRQVYVALRDDLSGFVGERAPAVASTRFQLGQPVACGPRAGQPASALRLCASARLVVEAAETNVATVIARAHAALDKAAWLASRSGP